MEVFMKKVFAKFTGVMIGLVLLAGIGWGLYLALEWVIAMFNVLEPQVARVTGLASLVLLLSAAIVAQSIRAANRRPKVAAVPDEPREAQREERLASYQLFLDFWHNAQRQGNPSGLWQGPMADKLEVLERLLALHGSAALMQAHAELRKLVAAPETSAQQLQARIAQALLVIREELGADTSAQAAQALHGLLFAPMGPTAPAGGATRLHTAFSLRG
jgi:hypothetical protein